MSPTYNIRILFVFVSATFLAACSDGLVSADESVQAPKLTNEYIVGSWCLAELSMMGNADKQNVNYVFHEDGTLQYQTAAENPVQTDGTWKIDDGKIDIMARPLMGPIEVQDLTADSFTLNFTLLYKFRRGSCSDSAAAAAADQ